MIWLQPGDRLPSVAMVQVMLRSREKTDPEPDVTGVFDTASTRFPDPAQAAHPSL